MGVGNVVWGAYNYVSRSQRRVLWDDAVGCPVCGADVPASAEYCPSCGEGLESAAERDRSEGVACPECDAVATAGARFCPACGATLAGADGTEPVGDRTDT
ncbi:zinc ribbon domain-containing protein [Natrinema versiforme]|uniref:DZANK-type domain-containing protein n=1 Tax=Natrinema versiforme JCM 10478 TaxID=1227496 RepID=L9YA20_9EURY|nr:hypothetical protein C489_02251 [Natrinema versiforme JCM 10478]